MSSFLLKKHVSYMTEPLLEITEMHQLKMAPLLLLGWGEEKLW